MSTVTVRLQRSDQSQTWGFRIHGGTDFNQPLIVLRVTAGSVSAKNGLQPGDQIIQINGQNAFTLRHREAQQMIISAGNNVEFQVIRGESSNMERAMNNGELPISRRSSVKKSSSSISSFSSSTTSTSSMSIQQDSSQVISDGSSTIPQGWKGPRFTEDSIKETLMSQAQVLKSGAMGVNFLKNEKKPLDLDKSEVFKMLNEVEQERKTRTKSPAPAQLGGGGAGPQPLQQINLQPSAFGLINRAYEAAVNAQQSQAPWLNQNRQLSPAPPAAAPVQ